MIFLGHIGPSLYVAQRWGGSRGRGWPAAAAVTVCALLPDLIDKLAFWAGWGPLPSGRLWAHSLLFSLAWCLLCWAWLRGLWPWALATPGHLVLDRMWRYPATLLWPWWGGGFDTGLQGFSGLRDFWRWQYHHEPLQLALMLAAEVVGLGLTWRAWRALPPLGCADLRHRGGAAGEVVGGKRHA